MAEVSEFGALADDLAQTLLLPKGDAADLIVELRRFIKLKAQFPAMALSPSPIVDAAWHAALLRPRDYYSMCVQAQGHLPAAPAPGLATVIDHDPAGSRDSPPVRRARYVATLSQYRVMYVAAPPSRWWPFDYCAPSAQVPEAASLPQQPQQQLPQPQKKIMINVRTPDENVICYKINRTTRLLKILSDTRFRDAPVILQCEQCRVGEYDTPESLSLQDGDYLDVTIERSDC